MSLLRKYLAAPWYRPYDRGWKLCNYQKKGSGEDTLSKILLQFKDGNPIVINAFTRWSIEVLSTQIKKGEIKYCARALGSTEQSAREGKSLHKLAKEISNNFGIEFVPQLFTKSRVTKSLKSLNKAARREEVEGVFQIDPKIKLANSSILIVDDIRTTGTTLYAMRRAIVEKHQGVNFSMFVLAQTEDDGNSEETLAKYKTYIG
jgi:predicted amidophosphoribosyltransferase